MKMDAIEALDKLVPPKISFADALAIRLADNSPAPPYNIPVKGSIKSMNGLSSHIHDGVRWREIEW